jgi:hypothetical protein
MMDIYNHIEPTLASFESQQDWEDAIYYATTSAKHLTIKDFDKIVKQIEKKGNSNMSISNLRSMMNERFSDGRLEGIAEGESRGKAEFGRHAVLNVLRRRFKLAEVPEEIEIVIRQKNDPIVLDALNVHAATCQSLEEFVEILN